ncbi:MAG: phosphoribosyltransferase family protein [Proteobacteria bacterium]|nr:phosphoribosyltransferase family protein [Pseudomonadota bacterium]
MNDCLPKDQLIDVLLQTAALKFGHFQTKSGRNSPYFFDTSMLYTGKTWFECTKYLVNLSLDRWHKDQVSGAFGAAYKGIPLSVAFSQLWHQHTHCHIPFAFCRKETKPHGEGGNIVGHAAALATTPPHHNAENHNTKNHNKGVLLLDDVLTSGKSLRHSYNILKEHHIPVLGCVVLIDRSEKDLHQTTISAKQACQDLMNVPIISAINIHDVLAYLKRHKSQVTHQHREAIQTYLLDYGTG